MIRRTRTLAAATLLSSAFVLGACGDEGVSKEDYAQNLDEVCTDLEDQIEELGETQATSSAEVANRFDDIRSTIRDAIEKMKDLERPDGEDGDKAEDYVNRVETTVNDEFLPALDELEEAVRSKDEVKGRAAATRLRAIEDDETQKLAEDLGADECAED